MRLLAALSYNPHILATGGVITYDGNYKIHTFLNSGNFVISSGSGSVESLVVGGGEAGASGTSSAPGVGGVGGQVVHTLATGPITLGTFPIVVGASDSDSSFDGIVASGAGGNYIGVFSSITGSSVHYAYGGSNGYTSSTGSPPPPGTDGAPNTGAGGDGGNYDDVNNDFSDGGLGGSGIVILRYRYK